MFSRRVMFVFLPLFLSLILIISSAPIPNDQLVTEGLVNVSINGTITMNETITTTEPITYDDTKIESDEESDEDEIESTTVEYIQETTSIPEVVTDRLLFVNVTKISLDIDNLMKVIDPLLFDNEGELPATPTTETPEPFTSGYEQIEKTIIEHN